MKKKYQKPKIIIEAFVLNEGIAACSIPVNQNNPGTEDCLKDIFADRVERDKLQPFDAGHYTEVGAVCYCYDSTSGSTYWVS